ncbi:hypothetical protein PVK64_19030 [Aliivibrio sp. S4TY2]|uniref:hypothetical protein n=1 Tax=unclassified Aliivibrio TaxID=2645654 RepID=UPI002377FBF8|nr:MULTISPECIES: hypothetical protein [unclassified Aliivibrio]MDD9158261.1 hypothetical protein [Aliivibrio sp. S4TY2]MDD9162176.1 hypothetical protein [Aliivibrio sp. S4TY1]MDD9166214.1 hypothetical protein [Aliivibrio sp. S4MY2]MDD9170212.1 hypothetical protein [Aliivibrio sp. S4MY4]MDD9187263.1 hypothetical protein [Aliivibrio sp. S4MY3]
MKPITSKQEFLLFMAKRYMAQQAHNEPCDERFDAWGAMYDKYLSQSNALNAPKGWKYCISAFARFLFAGLLISIPAMLIISTAFTLSGYEPLMIAYAALVVLQLTYVSSAINLITRYIAHGLARKKA